MKLKSEDKAFFLGLGILFAWFSLYIMLQSLYAAIRRVVFVSIRGGTYPPIYLGGLGILIWFTCVLISTLSLAIGLKTEELNRGHFVVYVFLFSALIGLMFLSVSASME